MIATVTPVAIESSFRSDQQGIGLSLAYPLLPTFVVSLIPLDI